jgi:DNA-binding winged helix-turn-helix (wHTH) protein
VAPIVLFRIRQGMVFVFDEFVLDTRAFELTYCGRSLSLPRRPLDLLTYLVAHRDRVVTKEELLAEVWGGVRVTANALVQAIANVRDALRPCGRHAIRSVRGRGYRFVLPVEATRHDIAPRIEQRVRPRETVRICAHGRAPLGTFQTLVRAYVEARPEAMVEGTPLATSIARATTNAEIVALVLALFADATQAPALLVVEHIERADVESLLLYAALGARPQTALLIRGTCAWGSIAADSLVARLLRNGLEGAPEFAA